MRSCRDAHRPRRADRQAQHLRPPRRPARHLRNHPRRRRHRPRSAARTRSRRHTQPRHRPTPPHRLAGGADLLHHRDAGRRSASPRDRRRQPHCGTRGLDPQMVEALLRQDTLVGEQANLVRHLTTSQAGVDVIVGPAGAGKTRAPSDVRSTTTLCNRPASTTSSPLCP